MVIWKYLLAQTGDQVIEMPEGKPLCVQMQRGQVCIWAMVNPLTEPVQRYRIRVVGTGHDFDPTGLTYLGTFQENDGWNIYHVFYERL